MCRAAYLACRLASQRCVGILQALRKLLPERIASARAPCSAGADAMSCHKQPGSMEKKVKTTRHGGNFNARVSSSMQYHNIVHTRRPK